jgi:hypothetical protein
MPFRHEFDKDRDWMAKAEDIVADIAFDHSETDASFGDKIERLLAYNTVLAERAFRTHVVEEWDVPNIEVPRNAAKNYDPLQSLLRALTTEEKLEEERLISLGSYFGQKKTKKLADALRSRRKNVGHVLKRYDWRENCIRDATEGMFYTWARDILQELQRLRREDSKQHEIEEKINAWKTRIQSHAHDTTRMALKKNDTLMPKEREICSKLAIDTHMYTALKDLLIREFAIRGALAVDDLPPLVPKEYLQNITEVYRLCVECGWVAAWPTAVSHR